MSRITAIQAAKRRPGRFEIHIDDAPFAVVSVNDIGNLRLREGIEVDESLSAAIESSGIVLRVYDRAVGMLARRPRSATDLRRRLMAKGEPREGVDIALERLESAGILDERDYARQHARSRFARGSSRTRILADLARAGIPRSLADEAVSEVEIEESVDEGSSALAAAEKKWRSLQKLEEPVARRRLIGFLMRRGYRVGLIQDVVRQVMHPR